VGLDADDVPGRDPAGGCARTAAERRERDGVEARARVPHGRPEDHAGQAQVHLDHGVDLRAGTGVSEVIPGGVRLDDGSVVEAETVLVAIGSRPNTEWLTGGEHTGQPIAGAVGDEEPPRRTRRTSVRCGWSGTGRLG